MTLTTAIIALLISMGIIDTPADLDNLTLEQEQQIHQIIIEDDYGI